MLPGELQALLADAEDAAARLRALAATAEGLAEADLDGATALRRHLLVAAGMSAGASAVLDEAAGIVSEPCP